MDHLNTETWGEVLSLKVSFCTVTCYKEEIKAREPFLADLPECKGGELGSWRRKQRGSRTDYTIRTCSFLFFVTVVPGWGSCLLPQRDIQGWGLEKAVSHVWPPEVNSALQRYYGASLPDLLLEKQVVHHSNVFIIFEEFIFCFV